MNEQELAGIADLGGTPEKRAHTLDYLADKLGTFMRPDEAVLICIPRESPGEMAELYGQAVLKAGGSPIFWGPDLRWKTLLRHAFSYKVTMVIGEPLVLLGLTKLARASRTPLYIENAVIVGSRYQDWMAERIQKGLDCRIWRFYSPKTESEILGLACPHRCGIHLRDNIYGVRVTDELGNELPEGNQGRLTVYPKADPSAGYIVMQAGYVSREACDCGFDTLRMVGMDAASTGDALISDLEQMLYTWNSILDCRVSRGEFGIELELVTFRGEKLPSLPSVARQVVRTWDPDNDRPFWLSAE